MTVSEGDVRGPYRGLVAFGDSDLDALLFFGREHESDVVVANLIASRLTVLYGPSGVGKSSLLSAAVARAMRALPERPVVVVFSTWGEEPAAALADAVADAAGIEPEASLVETVAAAERARGDVYLILDQFEEYFLYHGDEREPGTFADALPQLLAQPVRVNVLLSLRDDALAKLDRFKGTIPNLFGNYLRLDRLDRAAGRAAIVRPVERWSELEDRHAEIEPALVEAALDDVGAGRIGLGVGGLGSAESGAEPAGIEAPYLQLVMQRLWDVEQGAGSSRLRLQTLEELGGARRIVADHLERAVGALTPSEQGVAARLFNFLVTPSGTKIAHGLDDLAEYAGVPENAARSVARKLAESRILRPDEAGRYEIFHDVLAGAVLGWRTQYEREQAVERAHADARRRHRRLLAIVGSAFVALAAMTSIAAFALVERSHARSKAALASQQRARAERQSALARAQSRRAGLAAARAAAAEAAAKKSANRARAAEAKALHLAGVARREAANAEAQKRIADTERGRATARAAEAERARQNAEASARAAAAASRRAQREAMVADRQRTAAQAAARLARAEAIVARSLAQLSTDPDLSLLLAVAAAALERTPSVEDALRRGLLASRVRRVLPGGGGEVRSVDVSPDGSLVVTASLGGGARLFASSSGALVRVLQRGDVVRARFSGDGSLVATASRDGRARLWGVPSGALLGELQHSDAVTDVAFSEDGSRLATASVDHTTRIWQVSTGQLVQTLRGPSPVRSASFSPDGARVLTVASDRFARLYDVAGGKLVRSFEHRARVLAAAFSPDGRVVATAGADRVAVLWDASTGAVLHELEPHGGQVVSIAFSSDGKNAVTASTDAIARVWDVETGRELVTLPGHRLFLTGAEFSPDGLWIVTSSTDATARVWRLSDGAPWALLAGDSDSVGQAVFSPDSRLVVTASDDGTARLWDPGTAPNLVPVTDQALRARLGAPARSARSPDGRTVATIDGSAVRLVRDGKTRVLAGHTDAVNSVAFSADGRLLVTASDDHDVRVWNVSSGATVFRLVGHFGSVADARFSPDGRWIVSAGPSAAGLWNASTGELLGFLQGPTSLLTAAGFLADSRTILTSEANGLLRRYVCLVCGTTPELLKLAASRIASAGLALTPAERRRYLG